MQLTVFMFACVLVFFLINTNFVNCRSKKISYPKDNTKYENSECKTSDGFDGICKKNSDCPINRFKPKRSDICSFVKQSVIYCCAKEIKYHSGSTNQFNSTLTDNLSKTSIQDLPNTSSNPLPTITVPSTNTSYNSKTLRPAQASCALYYPYIDTSDDDPEIFVGGNLSLPEEHPHMAAIGWTGAEGVINWKCGGSVISENFIITAAHCTTSEGIGPDVARTGDLNLLVAEENIWPVNFTITAIFVHPDYASNGTYHDIGLLKFRANFVIDLIQRPACLWVKPEIPVNELLGMGYGTTRFGGPRSNELYQGSLAIVPNNECSRKLPMSSNLPNGIIPQQLCAQDPEHIKDTCQGDSGGPVQFYIDADVNWNPTISAVQDVNRKPMIVGITSFGENCAGETPGVYTRISEYIDWIESIVWPPET